MSQESSHGWADSRALGCEVAETHCSFKVLGNGLEKQQTLEVCDLANLVLLESVERLNNFKRKKMAHKWIHSQPHQKQPLAG